MGHALIKLTVNGSMISRGGQRGTQMQWSACRTSNYLPGFLVIYVKFFIFPHQKVCLYLNLCIQIYMNARVYALSHDHLESNSIVQLIQGDIQIGSICDSD